jgi:FkbM family methyltransferase
MPMNSYHEVCRTRHGVCIVNVNDQYVSRGLREGGAWCPHELDLLQRLIPAAGTVVEAGANYGAHTIAFARFVGEKGRVYAFEPQRIVFQALCGSVALNCLSNVVAYNAAVGDSAGSIEVPCLDYTQPENFGAVALEEMETIKANRHERVPVMTIDHLELPQCHLIKADVEGMESAVVRGARATITRYRPFLYLENHDDERRQPLIDLCHSMRYSMYWHGTQYDPNMLCIPAERGIKVEGLLGVSVGPDAHAG